MSTAQNILVNVRFPGWQEELQTPNEKKKDIDRSFIAC